MEEEEEDRKKDVSSSCIPKGGSRVNIIILVEMRLSDTDME